MERYTGTVHAETVADCPFSIAEAYATEYFAEAERGGEGGVLRAGPLGRSVALQFTLQSDRAEPGRRHDEIVLRWSAGSKWLPDLDGTLRMRVQGNATRLMLEGRYVPPGGPLGVCFDAVFGRFIARATARDAVRRVALALEEKELLWRAGLDQSATV